MSVVCADRIRLILSAKFSTMTLYHLPKKSISNFLNPPISFAEIRPNFLMIIFLSMVAKRILIKDGLGRFAFDHSFIK